MHCFCGADVELCSGDFKEKIMRISEREPERSGSFFCTLLYLTPALRTSELFLRFSKVPHFSGNL